MIFFKHLFISTILIIGSTFCCAFFIHTPNQENSDTFQQMTEQDTDGCYNNSHHDISQKLAPSKKNNGINDATSDVRLSIYPTTKDKTLLTNNSIFYERKIFDRHKYFFTDTIRLVL